MKANTITTGMEYRTENMFRTNRVHIGDVRIAIGVSG
jgi:hypothetical protein